MFISIINDLWHDSGHVMSCHSHLVKRKKAQLEAEASKALLPEMLTVAKVPEYKKIELLKRVSEFTTTEIVAGRNEDGDCDKQLVTFGIGMAMTFKLSEDCRYPAVLESVFDDAHAVMGERLNGFKKKAWDPALTTVNWWFGVYTLVYNEAGFLMSVRHISGESASTPSWASHIDKSWALQSNWDDWNASLGDDASPPVPVRFF